MTTNPNDKIWGGRREGLPMSQEQRRGAAAFWYDQVDAAAIVEADAKIDGGSRARGFGRREEEYDAKRHGGENEKDPLVLFIKAKG